MSDLESSLAENRAQLSMIEMALKADPENAELQQLKTDLETLINLTLESSGVDTSKGLSTENSIFVDDDDDDDDIEVLKQTNNTKSLEEDLSSLEGVKVSAPFSTSYSGKSFHNAVVFAVESKSFDSIEEIIVRVVFSHPTEIGMVACKHFLEGRCRREDAECRWSHGERVSLSNLQEWQEPDWNNLDAGAVVLVKQENGVWSRARVQGREEQHLVLKMEGTSREPFLEQIENVVPLNSDLQTKEESDDEEDSTNTASTTDDPETEIFVPKVLNVEGRLGDWETHTRGVGSRLMSKMGWTGGGLGKEGEGRVDPVEARLYPQGKSLDWCMERREEAGGGDISSVEKTLKKQAKLEQKKSEQRARKEKERDNSAKSLFDLINVKLGGKRGNISDLVGKDQKHSKNGFSNNKTTLKAATNQNLKVESFKLGERIKTIEKDIARLKESWTRHREKDPRTADTIKSRINEKEAELKRLQSNERKLAAEQGNRKSSSKLSIF